MHDRQYTRRHTCTLAQLGNDHSCAWITFRGFEYESVSGSYGDHVTEGNHSGEVEWTDGYANTEGLSTNVCVHVSGYHKFVAHEQLWDRTSRFDNLMSAEDFAQCVGVGLAVLQTWHVSSVPVGVT